MSDSTATDWNLVAAGPSREHLRQEHLLDGPVVTVNRAIDIVKRGLRVDFAAFADSPKGCWEQDKLETLWNPDIQLWVTLWPMMQRVKKEFFGSNMPEDVVIPGPPCAYEWDRVLPASIGFRFIPTGDTKDPETGGRRAAFTVLCALKRIAQFGAKRIRILCADMAGPWHPGMTEEECDRRDQEKMKLRRWLYERAHLEAEIKRMRKEDIEVEQVTPAPLEAVASAS